jgi:pimeloyl-ACP methyl ester carboxylesterase
MVSAFSGACSSAPDAEASASDENAIISHSDGSLGPREFRNIFYSYYTQERGRSEKTDESFSKTVYLGSVAPDGSRIKGVPSIDPYDSVHKGLRASDLHSLGKQAPAQPVPNVDEALEKTPIHIVLVPGILGEFIDVRPFEEVLADSGQSRAARDFAARLQTATESDRTDPVYSLEKLDRETKPLSDVVNVASIDDEQGRALATLAYLRPTMGSMESLGSLDSNVDVYLPRLDKYMRVMGNPKNVVFLGYSRGAPVALHIVARANDNAQAHPWVRNVVGVSSLSGVLYGTQLADAEVQPNVDGQVKTAVRIADSLESCGPGKRVFWNNTRQWINAINQIRSAGAAAPADPGLDYEQIDPGRLDAWRTGQILWRLLGEKVLKIGSFFSDYCRNVDRFKTVVHAVADGTDTLTTQSRMDWWRTHTIPSGVRLFALTSTMGDPTVKPGEVSPLAKNEAADDVRALDFKNERTSYYNLLGMTKTPLNDADVTVPRGRFWPELNSALNPRNQNIPTYYMGTISATHWGVALNDVIPTSGAGKNPFPRRVLLKSMARFIAESLK